MAQPVCTFCEQEYGVLMDSDLIDGGTQVVGPTCLPGYALVLAATATTGMTSELVALYGTYFDQIAANDTRPKKSPVKDKSSGRKATASKDAASYADDSTSGRQSGQGEPHTSAPDTGGQTQSSALRDSPELEAADGSTAS